MTKNNINNKKSRVSDGVKYYNTTTTKVTES